LAGTPAKRPGIEGASLSLDPRAKRVIERSEEEARRLGDEYVSTEHLLLGTAEGGGGGQGLLERHGGGGRRGPRAARTSRRRPRGDPRRPPGRARRPAGHVTEPRGDVPGARE